MLHGAKCQPPKLLSSGRILHTDIPDLTLDASDKNVGNKGTAASLASDFEGSGLWLSSAWQRSAVQCCNDVQHVWETRCSQHKMLKLLQSADLDVETTIHYSLAPV